MPRLVILTDNEIKSFDKPPKFTKAQREKYFLINGKLSVLLITLRDPNYRLCVTLQWGYFRASGRFFSIKDFHLGDVRYICSKLNIPYNSAYLKSYQNKRKTIHQRAIPKSMNFRPFNKNSKTWLEHQLINLVTKQMQTREIICHLAYQCYQQ